MSSGRFDWWVRVLVADDHPLLREGIAALIGAEPDMQLVGEASTGREALAQFKSKRPDVTLMDLQMPEMGGVEAMIHPRRIPECPHHRPDYLHRRRSGASRAQAGARAYLLKGRVNAELLEVIRAVHRGQKRIPPEIAEALADHAAEDELSTREAEVLRLVAAGNSNKEIAAQLFITEETVKNHVTHILSKLGANDRTHAVTIGIKRGIIDL